MQKTTRPTNQKVASAQDDIFQAAKASHAENKSKAFQPEQPPIQPKLGFVQRKPTDEYSVGATNTLKEK